MKKLLATVIVLMASAAGQNVQYAPSREQCRAIANLWDRSADELAADVHLSVSDLGKRMGMMGVCSGAYPKELRYQLVATDYLFATSMRVEHFLERHPQVKQQFFDEDAAGMR